MSKKRKETENGMAKKVLTPLEMSILEQAKSTAEPAAMRELKKRGPMRAAMEMFGSASVSQVIVGCELPLTVDELVALKFIGQTIKKPTSDNVKTYALLRGDLKDNEVAVTVSKVDEDLMGAAIPDKKGDE